MDILDAILRKIENGQFEFSQHATDQSIIRGISIQEFREAVSQSERIEDYPDDKYGPSCLLLGFTSSCRPLAHPIAATLHDRRIRIMGRNRGSDIPSQI